MATALAAVGGGTWLPSRPAAVPLGGPADPHGYGPLGVAVRLVPQRDGLPVDAVRVVRLGPDGRVLGITGDDLPTAAATDGAPIPLDQAHQIAARLVGGAPAGARLSWQPVRGVLRRVWTVERTGSGSPHAPVVPQVRIDAVTGGVLSVDDAALDAAVPAPLARVYPHNPVVDAAPVEVPLPLATEGLFDDRIEVQQCRDLGETAPYTTPDGTLYDLHVCTRVAADGPTDGNYLYDPDPWPVDPGRDEDDFAAAHAYWHTQQGFLWFEALGWTPLPDFDPYTSVVVNHRLTDLWTEQTATDPAGALAPYRNAYFTGGYESQDGWVAPQLVFGQGPLTDFAYDGDVIHHELGHLIVASRGGPRWTPEGVYGPSVRAGALNEGFADYFSSAFHGDPLLSEYVSGDGTPTRDLEGGETCAANQHGEVHFDSLPFSGALWALRSTLSLDQQTELDRAVLDALSIMGVQADFPDAAEAIETLVGERLGDAVQDALWAAFDGRGLHECLPVSDVAAGPEPFRAYARLSGSYWYSTIGAYPASVQYRIEVPDGGARITLSLLQAEFVGFDPWSTPTEPLGVVGRSGAAPIAWDTADTTVPYTTTGGGTFGLVLDVWTPQATVLGELTEVSNAPNADNEQYLMRTYSLSWDVAEAGPYVFQLTNAHPRTATAYDLTLTAEPLPPDTTPPTTSSTTPGSTDDAVDAEAEADKGCGCGGARPTGWLALAAVLWVRRVRTARRP